MKPQFVAGLFGGILLIGILFFTLKSATASPEQTLYRQGAKNSKVPYADYSRIMDIMGRVEKDRKFTDADWETVKSDASSDNLELRQLVLVCCSKLRYGDTHQSDAIEFAKDYLRLNQKGGNVSAVIILHNLRDPSWKEEGMRIENSSDLLTKQAMTTVMERFNEQKK